MLLRIPAFLAIGFLAAAPARALEGSADAAAPRAEATAPADGDAAAGRGETARLAFRAPARVNPYREHAPLAFFSLGCLAVGGVFYGIHRSFDVPGGSSASGDGTRVDMAIGAAGLSALAAGAAYFWYTLRAERPDASGWTETVAAGLTPDGGVAASVTLPLSSFGE